MLSAQRIRVLGVVQGVGFRPFVWRLARELSLAGWVRNDSEGVEISAEGSELRLRALVERLRTDAPPLARVDAIWTCVREVEGLREFRIAGSVSSRCATAIGPDTAVCGDCLAELFDPTNRRWRHPFITCTNCGPRYTIARGLPYDRSRTSMREFALCVDCAREYGDPADRRFHAEPIACPNCGPHLTLLGADGSAIAGPLTQGGAFADVSTSAEVPGLGTGRRHGDALDAITATVELLRKGAIVAVKGLGGYHLVCDARNPASVAALRERKNREAKPLAVMAANAQSLREYAELSTGARHLLASPERPIALVPKTHRADSGLAGIAPGMACLGVMLPSTPLQWLLFHEAAGRPAGTGWLEAVQPTLLVMTSANPGGEPLVTGDEEARQRLAGIADAFLQHDRDIVVRCDDSVVMVGMPADSRSPAPNLCFVRRARGYTPQAIRLPASGPPVLALGAYLKNTICVTRGREAFVSQHIGDLDDAATCEFFDESIAHLLRVLEVKPTLIVHDLHPDMPSTRRSLALAAEYAVPAMGVQHHHAHVAAVVAEHGVSGPVLGVSLDGVGFGTDGGAWGGELLVVDGADMRRAGHLATLPLPGGDRAAREPWRMAAAVLHRSGRAAEIPTRFPGQAAAQRLGQVLDRGVNCPPTSSMGRVFDAAAGLLGISEVSRFEAEAAMRLEALARGGAALPIGARGNCAEPWPQGLLQPWSSDLWRAEPNGVLDLLPLLQQLADWQGSPAEGAAFFQSAVSIAVAEWILAAAHRERLATIALSGGCFLNQLLREAVMQRLCEAKLRVLSSVQLPPNDGAISLGQAWVALCSRRT